MRRTLPGRRFSDCSRRFNRRSTIADNNLVRFLSIHDRMFGHNMPGTVAARTERGFANATNEAGEQHKHDVDIKLK